MECFGLRILGGFLPNGAYPIRRENILNIKGFGKDMN